MYPIVEACLQSHKIRFLHKKRAGKPILLFIPGNLQEIETIKDFNNAFPQYFDYYALELPGTGHTEPLHPSHHVDFLSDCLYEFVTRYIDRPINLVACSYATALAIEFAKRHSNLIDKLVLAGSMKEIPVDEWPTALKLMADCLRNPAEFAVGFMDWLTNTEADIPRQKTIIKATIRKASRYTENQFWCFIYNSIRLMAYSPRNLERITCPTLCFTGEHDPYVTPNRCMELASLIPGAEYKTLRDTDHLFHIERPAQTIEMILDYLQQTPYRKVG